MIKLIILDFDNTIYNYDYANEQAIKCIIEHCVALTSYSHDLLLSTYCKAKKIVNDKFANTALSHDKQLQIKIFVDMIFLINKVKITNMLSDMYYSAFVNNVIPYDNLYDYLNLQVKNNKKIVILTNNTLDIQLKIFDKLNLHEYINNLYSSYEIGHEKPHNNAFDYIVQKYKYNKDEILMIGDSKVSDYDGAINYGINAILFTNYNDIINHV